MTGYSDHHGRWVNGGDGSTDAAVREAQDAAMVLGDSAVDFHTNGYGLGGASQEQLNSLVDEAYERNSKFRASKGPRFFG